MAEPILVAQHGTIECHLLPALANRHGLITGATGTGKTITLQTMAESFSRLGERHRGGAEDLRRGPVVRRVLASGHGRDCGAGGGVQRPAFGVLHHGAGNLEQPE